jgi:sulfoxide reductase heme-binding subunit YedZ
VTVYFRYDVLDGQFLYVLSKALGLYAFVALWLQVMYGLLGEEGRRRIGVKSDVRLHRNLAIIIIFLFVLHIGLFVAGASLRNGHFAYALLLPNFFGPYYPAIVSLGLLGAVLLSSAAVFAARRTRWPRVWRWGHRLAVPAFVLIFFHSFLIGSETRLGLLELLYFGMGVSVLAALGYRLYRARVS